MTGRDRRRLRWGILATGGIARDFTADARAAGLEVVAVGSRSAERAAAFAAEFGLPRSHGSVEALLEDPDVDVVHIGTPHPLHAAHAVAAMRAGKHVLVEKPFTADRAEAEAVAAVAAETGLLAQEAMKTRFLPHMGRVRELVGSGALGEVRAVTADFSVVFPASVTRRMLDPALGGGALLDLGAYPVSLGRDLLGAPSGVHAVSTYAETGLDRQTSMVLDHPNGAHALFAVALDTPGPNRAVVVGTEARLELDPVWLSPTGFRVVDASGRTVETYRDEVGGSGLRHEALAVEQAVREGRRETAELPLSESVEIMGTLDQVRAAAARRVA